MAATGETITYRELDDRSLRLAQLLHARGLRRGDRVAILAENHPRYLEVYWAAVRSGLYLVAVNRHLAVEDAGYILRNSGATALVTTARLAGTARRVLPDLDGCLTRLMMDGTVPGFEPYEQAIAGYPARPLPPTPEMGEYVHAVVQLEPGHEPSDACAWRLRAFARDHLAGYKVPRTIDFRAELPRLPTGKLAKQLLRDQYHTGE